MNSTLINFIDHLQTSLIEDERKLVLQPLVDYIRDKRNKGETIRLNFICTHNSRRSHLAQIWAQTMAYKVGIDKVVCYSAGTEATALFPKVAETLQNQGFDIAVLAQTDNPIYAIKFSENEMPIIGFSKTLNNSFNPQNAFAAIMTCSSADQGCPFIAGADKRIPITYEDPKASDNTPLQTEVYAERSTQIATEMKWVMEGGMG